MAIIPATIATVLQQVASLSNSANWTSFNATVTATATALVALYGEQPFSAQDVGKFVVVRGAGAAGTDYVGNIVTVTNSTTADVGPAFGTSQISTPIALGGNYADDRHTYVEIIEAIFESDEQLFLAIGETPHHWARGDILTLSASVVNGDKIPSHTTVVGDPMIQTVAAGPYEPGVVADLREVTRWRANTGTAPLNVYGTGTSTVANNPLAGYYYITPDGYIFYTGADCKFYLAQYTRTTALQSPQVYQNVLVYGALRVLCAKDGDDPSSAAAWGKFWLDGIAAVRMGMSNSLGGGS